MFEAVKDRWDGFLRRVGLRPPHTHAMYVNGAKLYEFTPGPPVPYVCGECKATGVRLWREYNTFLDQQSLYCWNCIPKRLKPPYYGDRSTGHDRVDSHTKLDPDRGMVSSISGGTLVGARPSDDTFWGYSSGPQESVDAWKALPLESEKKQP